MAAIFTVDVILLSFRQIVFIFYFIISSESREA
jgi:hypothetical protein